MDGVQIDIDIFRLDRTTIFRSELVLVRYPHAHECGCDHMSMILNNLKGVPNRRVLFITRRIYMMKYSDVIINDMQGDGQ